MNIETEIRDRSNSKCELCSTADNLNVYNVPPNSDGSAEQSLLICKVCNEQIENSETMDVNHWRCLNDSMWTPVPAVQVMAWRILDRLKNESWAQDLLDTLYLEDDLQQWAESSSTEGDDDDTDETTKDSNGATLNAGDTVTLIKDLVVKGANFTAKRGTVVKNISLTDNPKHIEGKVNGTRIVLVSAFLKKA